MPSLTLIGTDDRAGWDAAAAAGLPSHGWHYAAGLKQAGTEPFLAVIEAGGARALVPFSERAWGAEADVATLPGLSGMLVLPHDADPAPLLALWRDFAAGRGWVTGYLQLSPRNPGLTAPRGDVIGAHNGLFEFDLARWSFDRDVKKKVRWGLRVGAREGAALVTDPDRLRAPFLRLYPQAMARLEGEIFAPEVLQTWFEDPATRLFGAGLDGEIEAVEFCRVRGDEAELHLAGSSEQGRGLHGWLIWQMAEYFAARGVRHFNIGGYGHAGDGLYAMKRRFGIPEHPLRSLRQIYRPETYARLCARSGTDPAETGYFPAYRAGA